MTRRSRQVWLPIVVVLVAINTSYLIAFDDPTLLRVGSGLIHLLLGLVLCLLIVFVVRADRKRSSLLAVTVAGLAVTALITGLLLVIFGNLRPQYPLLILHAWTGVGAIFITLLWIYRRAREPAHRDFARAAVALAVFSGLAAGSFALVYEPPSHVIENPTMPPANMYEEAYGGPQGMFFPSSAFTQDADTIPGYFFSRSETCGRSGCHPDLVAQWQSSAHRFSSFNNQWYRKSIEYMQDVNGLEAPKWCAGCHDQALLFSGLMAKPVSEVLHLPEAHAGTGCMSCHSIRSVTGTMGNGGIEIAYPLLHDIATSENRLVQILHDFALRIDPEPHRRAFLKPLHRRQSAEFCSACHKVHLDAPVNNYRWVRGFNTYDNWQASGVSGFGARSFYQPDEPLDCRSCHMPMVASEDAGNDNGFIRSHRFVAANTALPVANRDDEQLQATIDFLKADRLRVDVFAIVGGATEEGASIRTTGPVEPATTFPAGDEQGLEVGAGGIETRLDPIIAPLRPGMTTLRKGSSVRLDVVVRSLSVGHFFPSGTVDAQEAWLEVKVVDSNDEVVFWSGRVEDEGRGRVDQSAHFYRSRLVDAHANPINKRNAWAARSTVYVNLIPPGSADVAHYRLDIPPSTTNTLRVIASVHYRKFDWWHNRFAYAGVPDTNNRDAEVSPHFDDRSWVFTGSMENVSGQVKHVPDLPIVTMASDTVQLRIGPILDSGETFTDRSDRERWNDYGIALLREGDLKAAERAFRKVVRIEPSYSDGWVNLARVFLRDGNIDEAAEMVALADSVSPGFYKARYFRALVSKARGAYGRAIEDLIAVSRRFPHDRVVLGQLGRIYFLDGQLPAAIDAFNEVLRIDPEDLGAHYNLMLIQRALGNEGLAGEYELRYRRFKADERAPSIARSYRQEHPFDNNEALALHEHGDGRR